jgi:hypothetical protein
MTEPMIEETEAEDFTDELSDEALDREGDTTACGAPTYAPNVPRD